MPVFDASNFIQNTMTAAAAVKGEVYQDSNLVYQYQMMLNQLKQATNLDPSAMLAQFKSITSDISSLTKYTDALKDLYGGLQNNAEYASKVQALITQSGKTPDSGSRTKTRCCRTTTRRPSSFSSRATTSSRM